MILLCLTGEMSDNFQNYRNYGSHDMSPFAPPRLRDSLGKQPASQSPSHPSWVYASANSLPDQNWGGTLDRNMDSYSYVQSAGSLPEGGPNEFVATSPNKPDKRLKGERGNKHWVQAHTDLMLKVLCEEAHNMGKPDKSFKPSSLQKAAIQVNMFFGENYTPENVHNHLRG